MGLWVNNTLIWNLSWTAALSAVDYAAEGELLLLLEDVKLCRVKPDRRCWIPHAPGLFSVHSCYLFLHNRFVLDVIDTNMERALKMLWLNDVPSK
ncbi:hypothetical protein A2U01_0030266, partial [Trifolium medium]|nr:hypothetical protein [Trifolium medium]